ncbi:MAG: trigger factor [Phycisphaera sp.]|nr:MAG: trigger factor [Phycisphaera sp.]
MSESTEQRISTCTVSDAGPCLKRLSIEVPADVVTERIDESFDTLISEAALPGFRKGHAPKGLIEKRFGDSVRGETKSQLVATAYSESIEEHGIKVVGDPISESLPDAKLEKGQPLKFEVDVEVMPTFDLPELDKLAIKKPVLDVDDSVVADEIEKLTLAEGELEEQETAAAGDYISGHGIMKAGDEVIHDIPGAVVQVPTDKEGMILGVMVADFAKQLGKPKAGDEVSIKTKGPEHHEVEAVRGQDLDITFKVERVDRIIPAEIDPLLERFGLESKEKLEEAIKNRLEQRAAVEQQMVMRQQVASHLLKNVDMELPERLTAKQSERMLQRKRAELMYRGVDPMEIETNIAKLREASASEASRETKLFFMLSKVSEDRGVQIQQAEVDGAIAQMAFRQGVRPEGLRQQLIQNKQIGTIVQQVMEHKALDSIISTAEIEEVSKDEWEKFAKEQNN